MIKVDSLEVLFERYFVVVKNPLYPGKENRIKIDFRNITPALLLDLERWTSKGQLFADDENTKQSEQGTGPGPGLDENGGGDRPTPGPGQFSMFESERPD